MQGKRKFDKAHARALLALMRRGVDKKRPPVREPLVLGGGRKRPEQKVIMPRREAQRQEGDSDPPCMVGESGRVRPEAIAAKGFMIGQALVPWPSTSVWGIILGLPLALQAYHLAILGKQRLLAVALGELKEKDAQTAQELFEEADRLYRESGVKFAPENEAQIPINMAWALLYPLLDCPQADWPQNLLQRPRTDKEIKRMDKLKLGPDLVQNAEEIIETIMAYFAAPERDGEKAPFVLA